MYAAGYPPHDPLRTMDPRFGSRVPDNAYGPPHPSWRMPVPPTYPDPGAMPVGVGGHVPSPLSSPSNPSGGSPDDYFGFSAANPGPGPLPQQQGQEHWTMSAHSVQRCAYLPSRLAGRWAVS